MADRSYNIGIASAEDGSGDESHKQFMDTTNQNSSDTPMPDEEAIHIRGMTIDDFPRVFHIGEDIFTADYSKRHGSKIADLG